MNKTSNILCFDLKLMAVFTLGEEVSAVAVRTFVFLSLYPRLLALSKLLLVGITPWY